MVGSSELLVLGGNVFAALLGAAVGGTITYLAQKKILDQERELRKQEWAQKATEREEDKQNAVQVRDAQDRASLMLGILHLREIDTFFQERKLVVNAAFLQSSIFLRSAVPAGKRQLWQDLPPDPTVPVPVKLAREVLAVMAARKLHDLSNRMVRADYAYFVVTTLWRDYNEAKHSFGMMTGHLLDSDGSLRCQINDPELQPAIHIIKRMDKYACMIYIMVQYFASEVSKTLEMLASSMDGIGGPAVDLGLGE